MAKKPEPGSPFSGVGEYDIEDVSAIQILASGQDVPGYIAKRAFNFIVNILAATDDQAYRPERLHDTIFVDGRRFVGLQLRKLSRINLDHMKRSQHGGSSSNAHTGNAGRDPGRNPDSERKPG